MLSRPTTCGASALPKSPRSAHRTVWTGPALLRLQLLLNGRGAMATSVNGRLRATCLFVKRLLQEGPNARAGKAAENPLRPSDRLCPGLDRGPGHRSAA